MLRRIAVLEKRAGGAVGAGGGGGGGGGGGRSGRGRWVLKEEFRDV